MNPETWTPELVVWIGNEAFDEGRKIGQVVSVWANHDKTHTAWEPQCGGIRSKKYDRFEDAVRWLEWQYYRVKERLRCINECYSRISGLTASEECVNNLSELHQSVFQLERPEFEAATVGGG